jgi:hypothetical protein
MKHPRADSIRIWWCPHKVTCGRPHVVLLDKQEKPIAEFVVPVGWSKELLEADERGPE